MYRLFEKRVCPRLITNGSCVFAARSYVREKQTEMCACGFFQGGQLRPGGRGGAGGAFIESRRSSDKHYKHRQDSPKEEQGVMGDAG